MNQRVLDSLPVEQETTIREMFQNHPKRRLRERALMIILSSQGLYVKQIADILKLSVDTISDWLSAYEAKGFLGLYDQPIPGRPARLSKQQEQQIGQWLDHSPRDEGYQHSNWTLKLLLHHVNKVFHRWCIIFCVWKSSHVIE
jgi:transposase